MGVGVGAVEGGSVDAFLAAALTRVMRLRSTLWLDMNDCFMLLNDCFMLNTRARLARARLVFARN